MVPGLTPLPPPREGGRVSERERERKSTSESRKDRESEIARDPIPAAAPITPICIHPLTHSILNTVLCYLPGGMCFFSLNVALP
jgi:hypothetical protein